MKNQNRFILLSIVTSLATSLAFAPIANAGPQHDDMVPKSWYTLPEDPGYVAPSESAGFLANPAQKERLEEMVDRIFVNQRNGLRDATNYKGLDVRPATNRPKDWVPWRFVAFASDLAVSGSGLIGLLTFKGSASVTAVWQKREQKQQFVPTASEMAPQESVPTFAFSAADSEAATAKKVDMINRTVMSTGRVQNAEGLKGRISTLVGQFNQMSQTLENEPSGRIWYASRLRMDIQVAASGHVSFGTVGGDVRVRLEWYRGMRKPSTATQRAAFLTASMKQSTPMQSSLHHMVSTMVQDLSATSNGALGNEFAIKNFRVGIGLGLDGNVGVAKASIKAIGHIYFSPAERKPGFLEPTAPAITNEPMYMVDTEPSVESLQFAQNHGIKANFFGQSPQTAKFAEFEIDRENFRRGITKALGMGRFFTNRASQSNSSNWGISIIRSELTMSLTGDLGMVTLTGLATAQVEFANKSFN
jgi:hypothetical protein